jgi:N-acetylglucosamine-6-phosphate deacetylase
MSYADISFEEAVMAATHAPAKLIGLEGEMGRIAPGMRADLSFWDSQYAIIGTMVGGTVVYGPRAGTKTLAS